MFHQGEDARISGPAVSDAFTGVFGCMGILGALVERERTGRGRKVEVSMLEATIAMATEPLGQMFATGEAPSLFSRAAASQSYIVTCKDGKRIGLHMSSPDKFWQGLVRAIGREDLLEKYPGRLERIQHYEDLARELAQTFAVRNRDEWLPLLEREDVPFAPERRHEELADDPQVKHLDLFYEMNHPEHGKLKAAHRAIRYDGDNRSNFSPPPSLGEHTDSVLAQFGFEQERIDALRAAGII